MPSVNSCIVSVPISHLNDAHFKFLFRHSVCNMWSLLQASVLLTSTFQPCKWTFFCRSVVVILFSALLIAAAATSLARPPCCQYRKRRGWLHMMWSSRAKWIRLLYCPEVRRGRCTQFLDVAKNGSLILDKSFSYANKKCLVAVPICMINLILN